ncbi:DUF4396 domain-containing protein [Donghicola mangrovi]|uniref:DUF4396 domain-containing protein n=1 Tax=Donghicola mangrovi TaxID=2729614 RepID=A0A850Q5F6_9RHOB|nr:DUF4396 domain-containing protein [Donghicola mangrovi]NVO24183.1 DUF4396 domain-containing protein [Donghicola mangrovi]
MNGFVAALTSPTFLVVWACLVVVCQIVLQVDLRRNNSHLMSLMKLVWSFTVLYSGPFGLAIYWFSGRKEIPDDSDYRRAFRSVAHCYSGCGLGELAGLLITVGIFGAGQWVTVVVTFLLAYAAGYALTVGPLVQDGVGLKSAMKDAVISETPSIFVMEVVALTVDLLVAGNAGPDQPIFWSSLVLSLSCGLIAAWPVNLWLIRHGIKEGMMDPRMTDHHHGRDHHHQHAHG